MASLATMLLNCLPVAIFVAIGVAVEFAWPRKSYSLKSRFPVVVWFIVQPALVALASYPVMTFWRQLGVAPLVDLTPLGFWAGAAAMLVIFDGLRYFTHRLEHVVYWPVHAVHHSIRDLHAVNSYSHPLEGLVEAPLILIPLSLIHSSPGALLLAGAISGLQNVIIHSPIRGHLGPLRAVFVDGPFHRIHHSLAPQHHDRNFGFVFSFWDRLFGTAHEPNPSDWPATGLDDLPPPETFIGMLLHPLNHFRRSRPAGQTPG